MKLSGLHFQKLPWPRLLSLLSAVYYIIFRKAQMESARIWSVIHIDDITLSSAGFYAEKLIEQQLMSDGRNFGCVASTAHNMDGVGAHLHVFCCGGPISERSATSSTIIMKLSHNASPRTLAKLGAFLLLFKEFRHRQ